MSHWKGQIDETSLGYNRTRKTFRLTLDCTLHHSLIHGAYDFTKWATLNVEHRQKIANILEEKFNKLSNSELDQLSQPRSISRKAFLAEKVNPSLQDYLSTIRRWDLRSREQSHLQSLHNQVMCTDELRKLTCTSSTPSNYKFYVKFTNVRIEDWTPRIPPTLHFDPLGQRAVVSVSLLEYSPSTGISRTLVKPDWITQDQWDTVCVKTKRKSEKLHFTENDRSRLTVCSHLATVIGWLWNGNLLREIDSPDDDETNKISEGLKDYKPCFCFMPPPASYMSTPDDSDNISADQNIPLGRRVVYAALPTLTLARSTELGTYLTLRTSALVTCGDTIDAPLLEDLQQQRTNMIHASANTAIDRLNKWASKNRDRDCTSRLQDIASFLSREMEVYTYWKGTVKDFKPYDPNRKIKGLKMENRLDLPGISTLIVHPSLKRPDGVISSQGGSGV